MGTERAKTFWNPKTLWKRVKGIWKTDALITVPYHTGRAVLELGKLVLKPILQVFHINWLGRSIRDGWRWCTRKKEKPKDGPPEDAQSADGSVTGPGETLKDAKKVPVPVNRRRLVDTPF